MFLRVRLRCRGGVFFSARCHAEAAEAGEGQRADRAFPVVLGRDVRGVSGAHREGRDRGPELPPGGGHDLLGRQEHLDQACREGGRSGRRARLAGWAHCGRLHRWRCGPRGQGGPGGNPAVPRPDGKGRGHRGPLPRRGTGSGPGHTRDERGLCGPLAKTIYLLRAPLQRIAFALAQRGRQAA